MSSSLHQFQQQETPTHTHCSIIYRALDAPEIQEVEVTWQRAGQWGEGAHGGHAVFPGQHGKRQHIVV